MRYINIRFRLRTLLVVFLVLCPSLAWMGVQRKWIRDRQEVFTIDHLPKKADGFLFGIEGSDAPWSIRFLGAPGYSKIYVVVNDTSRLSAEDRIGLRNAKAIFPEAHVEFATLSSKTTGPNYDGFGTW